MRCKSCEYALWNLAARQCPECGTGFKPSDFDFTLNSVQYRCPHCGQPYYGTGSQGHLVPKSFTCVSCNTPVDMDDMVLLPTDGLHEDQTKADEMPWLARKRIGFFKGYFGTLGRSMGGPAPLIRLTPVASSTADAIFYATVSQAAIYGLSFGGIVLIAAGSAIMGGGGGGFSALAALAGTLLGAIVAGVVFALIWSLLLHLTLKVTGPTQAGLGRTIHAVAYSSGCNMITAVPCLGLYLIPFGFLWWSIAAIFMIRDGQKVSGLRASVAVLWFPVALLAGVIGLAIWGFSVAQTSMVQAQAAMAASQAAGVAAPSNDGRSASTTMGSALFSFRVEKGRFPDHALELVSTGGVTLSHFATKSGGAFSMPDTSDYRFEGVPFDEISAMTNDRVQVIATAAAAAITDPSGAHRLGDFVFFWKGIDPANPHPDIWTFAVAPLASDAAAASMEVGLANGTTQSIPVVAFEIALEEQNILRKDNNLPEIPNPRLITDDIQAPPQ